MLTSKNGSIINEFFQNNQYANYMLIRHILFHEDSFY
jgi:hypothetical protein